MSFLLLFQKKTIPSGVEKGYYTLGKTNQFPVIIKNVREGKIG
jgi:hypothetical protein